MSVFEERAERAASAVAASAQRFLDAGGQHLDLQFRQGETLTSVIIDRTALALGNIRVNSVSLATSLRRDTLYDLSHPPIWPGDVEILEALASALANLIPSVADAPVTLPNNLPP